MFPAQVNVFILHKFRLDRIEVRKNVMPINLESLSSTAQRAFLARLAHALTICARDTYEVGTENVLDSRTLRAYNELLLRVSGSVVSHLSGRKGIPYNASLR